MRHFLPPTLTIGSLARGVIARSAQRSLVAPARSTKCLPAANRRALRRAVDLPAVARLANPNGLAAPLAAEQPVTLDDARCSSRSKAGQRLPIRSSSRTSSGENSPDEALLEGSGLPPRAFTFLGGRRSLHQRPSSRYTSARKPRSTTTGGARGTTPISVNLKSIPSRGREDERTEGLARADRRRVIDEDHRGWWLRRGRGGQAKGKALVAVRG